MIKSQNSAMNCINGYISEQLKSKYTQLRLYLRLLALKSQQNLLPETNRDTNSMIRDLKERKWPKEIILAELCSSVNTKYNYVYN